MEFANHILRSHHDEILRVWSSRYEELMREVCYQNEGKNFLDIGANTGAVIQSFNRHAKFEKVFAFEPIASNVDMMTEVLKQTLHTSVETYMHTNAVYYGLEKAKAMTCGDNNTGGMFLDQVKHTGNSNGEGIETDIIFDCCTLEEKMPYDVIIDICKIDVEGSEWNILENSDFVRKNVRNILLEYHWCNLEHALSFCQDKLPEFEFVKHVEGTIWLKSKTLS